MFSVQVLNRDLDSDYDLDIESCADWQAIVALAVKTVVEAGHQLKFEAKDSLEYEISLSFVEDEEIQSLNSNFRDKDKPTDVLSFNAEILTTELEGEAIPFGDIIICPQVALKQSVEYGYSFKRELVFLFIHGVLPSFGF